MTNPLRTWNHKPHLAGVIRKNGYEGCDVKWNEKRWLEINLSDVKHVYNKNNAPQLDVRNEMTRDCHRNCPKFQSHVGHRNADTDGQRIVENV
ncbi:hypothetical protein TNCV_1872651 [Trichonephila clavipes]|nr:hypothetical protein TNCV_1872651 [Trichonephila clavipes]